MPGPATYEPDYPVTVTRGPQDIDPASARDLTTTTAEEDS